MTDSEIQAGGPSEKAVEAAFATGVRRAASQGHNVAPMPDAMRAYLEAAHDPALGLDRSVCLRDLLEALRQQYGDELPLADYTDFIERKFGGG